MSQARKPVFVQAFVAQPAVEALDIRVLDRLAGLDVNYVDAPVDRPGKEVARGDFRAAPASTSFSPAIICASVCLLLLMASSS